ncbi:BREX-1 system adenine-specific DNA-methyltransferase PglX [Kribbella soli]
MTLSKLTRDSLNRTVRALRWLFEDEFGKQASGRFGIRDTPRPSPDRIDSLADWLDPVENLSLTPVEIVQRDELIHALRYLCSEGLSGGGAVQRLIREAAFTAVNRLLAVRVAEAIGVVPEVLARGLQSAGYRDAVGDLFPVLAHDEGSYWAYVQVAGDELSSGVPRLFDRRHPASAFVPSRACVDKALELIDLPELTSAWAEPEALGWSYQFFNGDDVAVMRSESAQPRNSRELAVRNQFFTPRYVVDWLVQNTLGRRLAQAAYDVDLPLLVGEIGDNEPLALEHVRVLDPAVGSGHFLLGCYDLLEQAWTARGLDSTEAAAKILPCLFGVDIDPRAAQVAQAVLLLRARRAAPAAELTAPTIVTAVALPRSSELQQEAFGGLSSNARDLADTIADALSLAPQLGTLLKVEQRLASELTRVLTTPKLASDASEATILEELNHALERLVTATSTSEERMFTAEAKDALRFLAICQKRYDAVLMNPPFGDPIPETKDYIRASYGTAATDIYSAFVARGVDLLNPQGYVGAITSRTGFFLTSFREWRADLLLPRLRAMLDLGVGVMHEAMVEAAAYVLQARPHTGTAAFRRLLDEPDRASAIYAGTGLIYEREPHDFNAIPEQPVAYWLPDQLLTSFSVAGALEGEGRLVRVGAQTSDDFRHLRLWWECVQTGTIDSAERWVTFAKGGSYSPYYLDLVLCVEWDHQRGTIRGFTGRKGRTSEIPSNRDLYGNPGLGWSRRSQKGFSVRPITAGAVFADKGPTVLAPGSEGELDAAMGYLNSGLAAATLEAMVAFGSYEVGAVQRLPYVHPPTQVSSLARHLTEARRLEAQRVETDHLFVSPWAGEPADREQLVAWSRQIDQLVADAVGHSDPIVPLSSTYPTKWFEEEYEPISAPGPQDELSYVIGVVFGRWDYRFATGEAEISPMPGPYDAVPSASRGLLLGDDGLPAAKPPVGYRHELPADRLLHDDPGHPADIVAAIERAADVLTSGDGPKELRLATEIRDLRKFLREKFFAIHLKQYSASRRTAPIYWQLAVPSKRWGLWLYAPALSRESLFAISRAAHDKMAALNDKIARIRAELARGDDRELRDQAESLEDLLTEIEKFAATADVAAQSGWEPDLNDGFVLNAAPLEALFVNRVWRTQITAHHKVLQNGGYPWASVQSQFYGRRP